MYIYVEYFIRSAKPPPLTPARLQMFFAVDDCDNPYCYSLRDKETAIWKQSKTDHRVLPFNYAMRRDARLKRRVAAAERNHDNYACTALR